MAIIGIILTCVLGTCLLYNISHKYSIIQVIGLSFPIGIGIQTFLMFVLSFIGIRFHTTLIIILTLFIIVLLCIRFFIIKRAFLYLKTDIKERINLYQLSNYNFIWLACCILIIIIVYVISVKSLYWPTFASDSMTSFDLFAKGLAREGNIINHLILERRVGYGAAYPPLYSLALAYSYMIGFEISKIIPTLFFISFAISFYALTKEVTNRTNAVFFTLLVVAIPEALAQSAINITSVPQSIYAALGIISLIIWHKLREDKYFYISCIMLAFSAFTRSEGIIYIAGALIMLGYFFIRKREYKKLLFYFLIAIIPFFLWQIFMSVNIDIMEIFVQVNIITYPNLDFPKINKILNLSMLVIFNGQYYGITLYVFIIMILINTINIIKHKDNIWLLFIIFFSFFGYLALLNQFELKTDTMDNVVMHSGKRFFFGITFLMWCYIANNAIMVKVFRKIEYWLRYKTLVKIQNIEYMSIEDKVKLSVIMPSYNESATLSQIIEKVKSVDINKEIIIINDGSTDNTKKILKRYKKQDGIIVVHHEKNKGKGYAIRTARDYINGDIVIIQDADLETEPNDYLHLVKPIFDGKSKVVYGSRILGRGRPNSWKFYYGAKFITYVTNKLYGQNITDAPTCYKVLDSQLFKSIPLNCTGFDFCPEITAKISKRGFKIMELPMNYYPRTKEEGKKLRVKDGIKALLVLIKYKFVN